MAAPQLIQDFMRIMLLLAPSAAIICLVLAGLSLRQGSIPDAFVGSNFLEMDVLGNRIPDLAATNQLVSFVRSSCAIARRRDRHGLDGEPRNRYIEFRPEFRRLSLGNLACRIPGAQSDP